MFRILLISILVSNINSAAIDLSKANRNGTTFDFNQLLSQILGGSSTLNPIFGNFVNGDITGTANQIISNFISVVTNVGNRTAAENDPFLKPYLFLVREMSATYLNTLTELNALWSDFKQKELAH